MHMPSTKTLVATLAAVLALVVAIASRLSAQERVEEGDRVEVTVAGPRRPPLRFSGTLTSARGDSVEIREGREVHSFSRSDVLKWRRGVVRSGCADNIALGVIAGGLLGGAIAFASSHDDYAPLRSAAAVLPGALIGGIIGAAIKGVAWKDATAP